MSLPPFTDLVVPTPRPFRIVTFEVKRSSHLLGVMHEKVSSVHQRRDVHHLKVHDLIGRQIPGVRFILDGQALDLIHIPHGSTLCPLLANITKLVSPSIRDNSVDCVPHDVSLSNLTAIRFSTKRYRHRNLFEVALISSTYSTT